MDKTVAPSFDSDRSSLHSGNAIVTNVVQSFDQDSDKNSAHSGEITITIENLGYNLNIQSESLEVRGYTNDSYVADDHSDTVDPLNSIINIERNNAVGNSEKILKNVSSIHTKKVELDEKTFREAEMGLWEENTTLRNAFTILGLYLIKWDSKKKEYQVREWGFMLSYIIWFIWPLVGLLTAYLGTLLLGIDSDITDVIRGEDQSMASITVYILMLALTPAFQTYAIRVFNENLPSILEDISLLSQNDEFLEYRLGKTEAQINIVFRRDVDHKSKVHSTWLPEISFFLAGVAFFVSFVLSIIEYTERGAVFEEWYFLVMIAFYLFMPVFSTWFCIIFIEWHRKVYQKIHKKIGNDGAVGKLIIGLLAIKDDVMLLQRRTHNLGEYSDKIQDIFTQLSDGVFKYALGVNMLVYLATSIYSASRMLADPKYIYYIFPLSVSAVHIVILCKYCSDLMKQYRNVLSKLKDDIHSLEKARKPLNKSLDLSITQPKDHSRKQLISNLRKLRENLHDSPPEVVILGSFTVDYGMLSTIIGFILSYALIINELFNESTPVCNVVNPSIPTTTTSTSTIITGSALPITTFTTDPGIPSALTGGEIAGIVIGSVAGVALMIGGFVFCYIKKKLCFTKPPISP